LLAILCGDDLVAAPLELVGGQRGNVLLVVSNQNAQRALLPATSTSNSGAKLPYFLS
jgi:hypothetical protein